jgi:ribonuclease-3
MEALIGATYLDGGWPAAAELVMELLGARIAEAAAGPGGQDYKTRLQELSARRFDQLPRYEVKDEGPDHAKRFFARVHIGGFRWGAGEGRSKKQAEQAAARQAWSELLGDPSEGSADVPSDLSDDEIPGGATPAGGPSEAPGAAGYGDGATTPPGGDDLSLPHPERAG